MFAAEFLLLDLVGIELCVFVWRQSGKHVTAFALTCFSLVQLGKMAV